MEWKERHCCWCYGTAAAAAAAQKNMQIISTFDSSVPTMRMRNGLMRKSREASIQMFTIISMVALHAHECIPHTTCNLCVCRVASWHRAKWEREKPYERSVCAQCVYANSAKRTLFRVVLQIKSKQREEKEFYVHFFALPPLLLPPLCVPFF